MKNQYKFMIAPIIGAIFLITLMGIVSANGIDNIPTNFLNSFLGIFPSYLTIDDFQRASYVVITMGLVSALILFLAGSFSKGFSVSPTLLILIGIINFILFGFFVILKYISIGVVIMLSLIGIGYLVIKLIRGKE